MTVKRTPLLRRTRLRTRKGLARTGPLARKTRLAPVNAKRKAKRDAIQFHSPEFKDWVKSLGCVVNGCHRTDIDPAHVVKRSRGLERSTWRDIVPLCRLHHDEQEGRNAAFEARHGLDLADLASVTAQRWMAFTRAES